MNTVSHDNWSNDAFLAAPLPPAASSDGRRPRCAPASTETRRVRKRRRLGVGKPAAPPARGAPERALMRAVLADAIRCLALVVGRPAEREKLARAARRWVMTMDATWPYSFDNVCLALSLDPSGVRPRLLGEPTALKAILQRLEEHLLTA